MKTENQIIWEALQSNGAICSSEFNSQGNTEIIANWENSIWRVLAKKIITKDEKLLHFSIYELNKFKHKAYRLNQIPVIAWIYSDLKIEYQSLTDERVLQPYSFQTNK